MTTNKFKESSTVVDINDIIDVYAEMNLHPGNGYTFVSRNWYFDPVKGKVIFVAIAEKVKPVGKKKA